MKNVSETGENLVIIIKCEYIPHNNWMTFFSWYTVQKYLPDAKCVILCKRNVYKLPLYNWTFRYKIPFYQISSDIFDYSKIGLTDEVDRLEISCEDAAINTLDKDNIGPFPILNYNFCTFVNYFNKCGGFIGSEWANSYNSPFYLSDKFITDDITLNEFKILKLWKECSKLFN